jgi:large subunit ribosomal protein L17
MLSNMASSLIIHKRIHTTLAKAKALRSYVEPLITKSKNDSTHSRRVVFATLHNKEAVNELFREVSPKVADRPGGYTRILKLGPRPGDNAEMAMMELVDYNENLLAEKADEQKKRKRTRRGSQKQEQPVEAVSSQQKEQTGEATSATEESRIAANPEPEAEKPVEDAPEIDESPDDSKDETSDDTPPSDEKEK